MKNLFSLFIVLSALGLFVFSSCADELTEKVLYGRWEGKYDDTELSFTFNADRTCLLSFNNNITGETDEIKGTFEMNFSKNPVPLSIRNIPGLNHGLYTIIEFKNDGSIKIADFSARWRLCPIAFEGDNFMVLRKVNSE